MQGGACCLRNGDPEGFERFVTPVEPERMPWAGLSGFRPTIHLKLGVKKDEATLSELHNMSAGKILNATRQRALATDWQHGKISARIRASETISKTSNGCSL